MKELQFTVQGSASAPYEVTFVNHEDGNLSAYCTCPAGENGLYCKHRFGILEGKRACRIAALFETGGWRTDESEWPSIQDQVIDAMIRLEAALRPYLGASR